MRPASRSLISADVPATLDLAAAADPDAVAHLDTMLHALQDALRAEPTWAAARPHVEAAFAAYDAWIAHVVAAHPMACRTGCTACCFDNPQGLAGVELARLDDALRDDPARAQIIANFRRLSHRRTDPETWRRRRIPCPLIEDGRCRTYAARPVACRAFHALTPAPWCDPTHARYAERVNPHLDPPEVLILALRVLSERLGLARRVDLHGGLAAMR